MDPVRELKVRAEILHHALKANHPEAIARTLTALRLQLGRAKELGVAQILIVGTESMRAAANSAEFMAQIAELGVPLRIISGDEEARLSFRSVVESMPRPSVGALSVLDIGGGSTELVVGGKDSGWKPFKWQSVKVGSVRMHERHIHSDPPTPSEQAALRATIRAAIKDLFHTLFCSGKNLSDALKEATAREWPEKARYLLEFVQAPSKKGVCPVRPGRDDE